MNKYQTYSLIGKILALDAMPSHRVIIIHEVQDGDIAWEKFIALADYHLVLQTLYPKIRDHELEKYFPDEVTEHLRYIFDLTTRRNLEIINQVQKLSSALNQASITPVFMKGVGNILDGLYKYPGERILHDIDILVPEDKFEEAAGILIRDGYQTNYSYNPAKISNLKHYPILFKPGEPVYVEIHRMPVSKKNSRFFNTSMVFKDARPSMSFPDCLVMSDAQNIIHNFLHAQLDHYARIYARQTLRNPYDLLLLSQRLDPEIVFSHFGYFRRASSGYLDIVYNSFSIIPSNRLHPKPFLHTYRMRHYLNLRYRFIEVASLFLIRVFLGYIVKPFKSISDKDLRMSLIAKLGNPDWYKKQGRYYKKVFGVKGTKINFWVF